MFERKLYPEFSWSLSRHNTLMDCSRKYAYHYYFSHNGWFRDSAELARDAYRLKKITNLPMLFGEIVHTIIETTIKNYDKTGHIPDEASLIQHLRQQLNSAFIDSTKKEEEWRARPKHFKMLHEIYYYGRLEPSAIAEIEQRIASCIHNFLTSESFTALTRKREIKLLQSEEFRTMTLKGVMVYIVIDFLYQDLKNDKWVIVDWKTGKENLEDRYQLALYALYLKEKYKVPLEKIEIRNEYLLTGTQQSNGMTEIDLEHVLERMDMSLLEMGKYIIDDDTNQPVDLDYFPKTEQEFKCARCNYKELCH